MRISRFAPIVCSLLLAGCAGRVPDDTSSIDIGLSDPSGDANVNLTRIVSASDYQRTSTLPLFVQATETPGPTGLSSRVVRVNIASPTEGTEYALVLGGTTYVELTENGSTGARVWRSRAGKLTLGQNDAKGSVFTLTGVEMTPFSGAASGQFHADGTLAIRF